MRSHSIFSSFRNRLTFAAFAGRYSTVSRRAVRGLIAVLVAVTLVASAVGDDINGGSVSQGSTVSEETEGHPELRLENLQVYFDGIDQYAITGQVTNCDEVGGVQIEFGGVFPGESTTTADDGYFFHFVIHQQVPDGAIVTAQATCHHGTKSDLMSAEIFY